MLVVITRPASEAQLWAESVRAAGHEPLVLPMICIQPVADVSDIQQAWRHVGENAAVMFVSGNAVKFFMQSRPMAPAGHLAEPIQTRAWATGPGTRQALLAHGWPSRLIDAPPESAAQFDSEALWAVVKRQIGSGDRVLMVRGETVGEQVPAQVPALGRDWLARRIAEAGATPVFCISYRRHAPELNAGHLDSIRGAVGRGAVWLFSSSEALNNLKGLMPGASWAQARAVVTHPRIAQQAHGAGFGTVRVVRPTVADVLASIESFV